MDALASNGAGAVRRGAELARRLIVENGVTYNVYADSQGRDRPWVLDPLPILLTAAEWRDIELGVAQRAELFDALLADLYGPQRLIADGTVPAELPFGHPNFLWPCHGITPAGGRRLQVYAVDISRSADGRWWALADRTQTPSGPGYALENRQIVSRVFRICWAISACARSAASSPRCARVWCAMPSTRRVRSPWCSRRARSTKPISSMPISPVNWGCRWWKAMT